VRSPSRGAGERHRTEDTEDTEERKRGGVVFPTIGIREAIEAIQSGVLDPRPLLTHSFSLDRLDEALAFTRDRPDGFMKAMIVL
jgi:threonine dehydrogenase-like Zn-dependent dehydrogenase